MRLDGGHEIEVVVGKWQSRNRSVLNLDSSDVDPTRICASRRNHTVFRIIDSVDFSLGGNPCELVDRSSAAATDIENPVIRFDRDMTQSPIGQFELMPVNVQQNEPANHSARPTALTDHFVPD